MNQRTVISCILGALVIASSPACGDEAAIAEIRKLYGKITNGKAIKTTKIPFNLEGDPMEGEIVRRTYPGGLTAIALSYVAGDHGGTDQHFYYNEKGVFFVFVKDSFWSFGPDSTAEKPTSIDTLTEKRYYIRDRACIRVLQRSASSGDGGKLAALVAKQKNKEIAPDETSARMIRRAAALKKITTAEDVVNYFGNEE